MGLFDNIEKQLEAERIKVSVKSATRRPRAYAAARMDRLTADWVFAPVAADQEIRQGMTAVRARARDLAINDPYARGFLRAARKNIVGSRGFLLQVKAKDWSIGPDGRWVSELDWYANALIERRFAEWARRGTCEVSGRFSFRKVQSILVTTWKRDGEAFVRKVRGANVNKFGFALQLIEPDHVDETYNDLLPNGNVVRMGIEVDRARRPVAYYVKRRDPLADFWGPTLSPGGPYDRVPAEDMIHVFDPDRFDQTRDLSSMSPAMTRLRHLTGYEEAAVVNARAAACKMGFFKRPANATVDEEYQGTDKDEAGRLITEAEPGMFEDIGERDFVPYDPRYPSEQHDPFVRSNLRGVATGLGMSYANLSSDLSDTSYASSRTGLIEEREEWKDQQAWFVETVLNDVFAGWLDMALLTGALGNLPAYRLEKFNAPVWVGRRWSWVDPLKDVTAQTTAVRAGIKAPSQIISEQGDDIEDVYEQLAEDQKLAEKYGLKLDYGGKADGKTGEISFGGETGQPADGVAGGGPGKGNGKAGHPLL